jgi:hypothetical protein
LGEELALVMEKPVVAGIKVRILDLEEESPAGLKEAKCLSKGDCPNEVLLIFLE